MAKLMEIVLRHPSQETIRALPRVMSAWYGNVLPEEAARNRLKFIQMMQAPLQREVRMGQTQRLRTFQEQVLPQAQARAWEQRYQFWKSNPNAVSAAERKQFEAIESATQSQQAIAAKQEQEQKAWQKRLETKQALELEKEKSKSDIEWEKRRAEIEALSNAEIQKMKEQHAQAMEMAKSKGEIVDTTEWVTKRLQEAQIDLNKKYAEALMNKDVNLMNAYIDVANKLGLQLRKTADKEWFEATPASVPKFAKWVAGLGIPTLKQPQNITLQPAQQSQKAVGTPMAKTQSLDEYDKAVAIISNRQLFQSLTPEQRDAVVRALLPTE